MKRETEAEKQAKVKIKIVLFCDSNVKTQKLNKRKDNFENWLVIKIMEHLYWAQFHISNNLQISSLKKN